MARTKNSEPKAWERLLMLMVNGGPFSKEQIEKNIDYEHMYRLSTLVLYSKYNGALIRVKKDGRKVVSYELVNVDEMKTYLSKRGFSPISIAKKSKKQVDKLVDLQAEKVVEPVSADVATAEVDVIEVTEVTE